MLRGRGQRPLDVRPAQSFGIVAQAGAMLTTDGQPLVVTEERLAEANQLGAATGIPVDPTGSAGLAGLLDLRQSGVVSANERVAVLFTGVRRD